MRDSPRSVMLFAAGFGTRMGALTKNRPKPLISVAGKALIDHALDVVDAFGADKVVANVHYLPNQVEAHLAGREIEFSRELPEILETGGGLRMAMPLLGDGPVFTMNTDAVWRGPNPMALLADAWNPDVMDALLLCVPKDRAMGHSGAGDFVLDSGGSTATRGPGLIYTGLQILKTDGLSEIPNRKFSLNVLWDQMLKDRKLHVADYPGQWCDVGRPESIPLAEAMLGAQDV